MKNQDQAAGAIFVHLKKSQENQIIKMYFSSVYSMRFIVWSLLNALLHKYTSSGTKVFPKLVIVSLFVESRVSFEQ